MTDLLREAGTAVTFTRTGRDYDPATDTSVTGPTYIGGHAIAVRSEANFAALGLTIRNALTLLFGATNYGLLSNTDAFVQPGDTCVWNGKTATVKWVGATAIDGSVIVGRIVVGF